jgi:hypothetical protein
MTNKALPATERARLQCAYTPSKGPTSELANPAQTDLFIRTGAKRSGGTCVALPTFRGDDFDRADLQLQISVPPDTGIMLLLCFARVP